MIISKTAKTKYEYKTKYSYYFVCSRANRYCVVHPNSRNYIFGFYTTSYKCSGHIFQLENVRAASLREI